MKRRGSPLLERDGSGRRTVLDMLKCQATDEGCERIRRLLEGADTTEERCRRLLEDLQEE